MTMIIADNGSYDGAIFQDYPSDPPIRVHCYPSVSKQPRREPRAAPSTLRLLVIMPPICSVSRRSTGTTSLLSRSQRHTIRDEPADDGDRPDQGDAQGKVKLTVTATGLR